MVNLGWWLKRLTVFLLCFNFEIYFAQAKTKMLFFAEKPEKCVQYESYPCALSSGQNPYYFNWQKSSWELAKDTVVSGSEGGRWRAALGHFVLKTKEKYLIDTPFAEIEVENANVFVELTETRVTVSVLKGQLVKVMPRGEDEPQLLSQGFSNWYGGIGPDGQDIGVPMVIDLQVYAKKRAHFFTDHKLGFVNELRDLAAVVKEATELAAQMHKELVAAKMSLLQAAYDAEVDKARKRREFNRYLRMLFRRKVNYDD